MTQLKERKLRKILEYFKNKDIILEFNDGIIGKIEVKNAIIEFDEYGFINIKNEKIDLKVNTTLLYNTKIKEEKKRLETRIDGQIELKIKTLDIKKK